MIPRKSFNYNLLVIAIVSGFLGCYKENKGVDRYCWQLLDFAGNEINSVCDKTEEEFRDCITKGTCGVYITYPDSLLKCNYFRIEGQRQCWEVNGRLVKNLYENQAKLYSRCYWGGVKVNKVDCSNYCHNWYTRERRLYKPTNTITYSEVKMNRWCGDQLVDLYSKTEKLIRGTSDSSIYLQYSLNGTDW